MAQGPLALLEGAIAGLTGRGVVVIVALDGFSGSGKSTLAHRVADQQGGTVLEADDFYRAMDDAARWALGPEEGVDQYFDWQRLRDEALIPLRAGDRATYRPYDWAAGGGLSANTVTVGPASFVVLDGVYSARPELAAFVDLAVLVDTPEDVRERRIASRNHGNDRWHSRWNAAERYYFGQVRPPESFDVVLPGD
jgi:uridine kinase